MSKSKLSSRLIFSRIALFTVIGSFLLIFMAAGTSAAGFSFMNSVKEFLGLRGATANAAADVTAISPGAFKITDPTSDMLKRDVNRRPDASFNNKATPVQNTTVKGRQQDVIVGHSYYNDTSPPLRDMLQLPIRAHEADDNAKSSVWNTFL